MAVGSIIPISGSNSLTKLRDVEQDDQYTSYHTSCATKDLYISDDIRHVSDNGCHASKGYVSLEYVDINLIPNKIMNVEAVQSGYTDHNNDDSKELTDGEVKRKREDELSLSPLIVHLFFLLNASINLNNMF